MSKKCFYFSPSCERSLTRRGASNGLSRVKRREACYFSPSRYGCSTPRSYNKSLTTFLNAVGTFTNATHCVTRASIRPGGEGEGEQFDEGSKVSLTVKRKRRIVSSSLSTGNRKRLSRNPVPFVFLLVIITWRKQRETRVKLIRVSFRSKGLDPCRDTPKNSQARNETDTGNNQNFKFTILTTNEWKFVQNKNYQLIHAISSQFDRYETSRGWEDRNSSRWIITIVFLRARLCIFAATGMMQCARSHLCKVQEPYAENAYRLQLHLYRGNNSTYRSRRAGHCDGATRGARTDTKVVGKCTNDKLWGKVFPFRVCRRRRSNRYRVEFES